MDNLYNGRAQNINISKNILKVIMKYEGKKAKIIKYYE